MAEQRRAWVFSPEKKSKSLPGTLKVEVHTKPTELIETVLTHNAVTTGADLIIMTTHGRGPWSRFWLGSVAEELVRQATTPILFVRPQTTAPDLTSQPVLRHILIPLGGSALAEQVLESAVAVGSVMQADYTLLRIYGPLVDTGLNLWSYAKAGGSEPSAEQLRVKAQDYLSRVEGRLKGQGVNVQTQVILDQHPASAILDAAQSLAVDLIALETHGRRGLPHLVLGSVADKVLRAAAIPLLIHRSPAR
jgi:nucleotide-binding universal stress UspA family protein